MNFPSLHKIELDLWGGLVADENPETAPPYAASDLQNVEISRRRREIHNSYGCDFWSTRRTVVGTAVIGLHAHRYSTATERTVALVNNTLYQSPTGASWGQVVDGAGAGVSLTAATGLSGANMHDCCFLACGASNKPRWYDTNANWAYCEDWPDTPSAGTKAASAGSGTTLGDHQVSYVFSTEADPNTEGAIVSPKATSAEVTTTAANGQITITTGYTKSTVPKPFDKGYAVAVMTAAGEKAPYWNVVADALSISGLAAAGTAVDIIVDTADSDLASEWVELTGPPATASHFFTWGPDYSRLGLIGDTSNPSKFYFTEPNDPFKFRDTGYIEIAAQDGDVLMNGAQVSGGVLLLKKHSTHLLTGWSRQTFQVRPLDENIGCAAQYSLVVHRGAAYWLSDHGCYVCNGGAQPKNISTGKVQTWIDTLNWSSKADMIQGGYIHEREQIWWTVPYGTSQTTPNKVLILDLRTGEFLVSTFGVSADSCPYSFGDRRDSGVRKTLMGSPAGWVLVLADRASSPGYQWKRNYTSVGQDSYWESHLIPTGGRLVKVQPEFEHQTNGTLKLTFTGYDREDDSATAAITKTVTQSGKNYVLPVSLAKKYVKIKAQINELNYAKLQTYDAGGENAEILLVAVAVGATGNSITIALTDDASNPIVVTVTGTDIVVQYDSATHTAANIITAINAKAEAAALVTASAVGTGALKPAALGAASLMGGTLPNQAYTFGLRKLTLWTLPLDRPGVADGA